MEKNKSQQYQVYPKINFVQFILYYLDLVAALCAIIVFAYEEKYLRLALTFAVFILERIIQIYVIYYITKGQKMPEETFEQIERQKIQISTTGQNLNVKVQKFSFGISVLMALTYSDCAYYYYLSKKCIKNIEVFNIVTKIRGLFLSNLLAYIIATGYMKINDDNYDSRKNEVAIYNITFVIFVFNFVVNNVKVYLDVSSKKTFNWEILGLSILIFIEFLVYLMWVTFVIVKFKGLTFVVMAVFGLLQMGLTYYHQSQLVPTIPEEFQEPNSKTVAKIYKYFMPIESARSLIFYIRYEDTTLDSIDNQDKLMFSLFTMRQKKGEVQTIALRILYILILCVMMLTKKKWVEDFFEEYTVIAVATTITFLIVHTLIVAIKTYFQKYDTQLLVAQKELFAKHFQKQKKSGILYPFYVICSPEEVKQKQFDLEDVENQSQKAKKKNQVLPQLAPLSERDSNRQLKPLEFQGKNLESSKVDLVQINSNLPKFRDETEEKKDIDLVAPVEEKQQPQDQKKTKEVNISENKKPDSKKKFLERKTPSYHDIDQASASHKTSQDSDFRKTEQGFRVNTQGSNQGSTIGGKSKKLKSNVDLDKLNKVSNMYDVKKSQFNQNSTSHKILKKAEQKKKKDVETQDEQKKTEPSTIDKLSKLQSSSTMDQQQQLNKDASAENSANHSPQGHGEFFDKMNQDEVKNFDDDF